MLVGALWFAAHRFPWVGALFADTLRAIVGTENVSRLEDFVYGLEDRWNQWWRKDEAPKAYWDVPSDEPEEPPPPPASSDDGPPPPQPFHPAHVGPFTKALAAQGDGQWVPVRDPAAPSLPAKMFKTLIHPDPGRPWAELFVVAFDLRQVELHLIAGRAEPVAQTPEGKAYERAGLIPADHQAQLLAGFNGGFKAQHGRWGMRIDGVTLIPGRKHGCTIGKKPDGALTIAPWQDLEATQEDLSWWRQTPPCMYLADKRHGGLWDPDSKGWGAALEGDTVIRRSALGLSQDRETLFISVSNHTSARAIADGMHHAGAVDVAQLDVNWSFPRIVTFPEEEGKRVSKSLFDGFEVAPDEYLREPCDRDFFYVVKKNP
ncbi:MAG: hypothetical protein KC731_28805 [Myxococcales bacterium]|nr:hypothetical protein [Myxococcales bacterium]